MSIFKELMHLNESKKTMQTDEISSVSKMKGSLIKKLDKIAAIEFGEFGFSTLSEEEMDQLIFLSRADRIAKKEFGEFGLRTCSEKDIANIINKNPTLVRASIIKKYNINLVNEDSSASDNTDRRFIVAAGEFSVYASNDGEHVFLLDEVGKVIVDMPTIIWKQLQKPI